MQRYKKPHEIIDASINVPKGLIILNIFASIFYLGWWFNFSNAGVLWLYIPLLIGEVYHVFQALGYAITIWDQKKVRRPFIEKFPDVDVFITVCGEPTDIVVKTVKAAVNMHYPGKFKVFILNDGKGRNAPNWQEVNEEVAKLGASNITRDKNTGAKAGNINNALKKTKAPLVTVFDADHVPHRDYLLEIVPHFVDEEVGLVQAPQYYENRDHTFLTTAAWEQQELFFGPICRGKQNMNATFWCGTNAVVRRKALKEIGGVPENNIAEDFLASLFMHENGWKSIYVPKILAKGLAPHDLENYVKQQFRWARGSSELMFKYNPILSRKLTFWQKLQYLYSSSYYLNGFIVLIDMMVPIIVLLTGFVPVQDFTASFIVFFLPFVFSTIYLLMASTENTITFRAIQLSMSSSFLFMNAVASTLVSMLLGKEAKFVVTAKKASEGNFVAYAIPHITYCVLGLLTIVWAISTRGLSPSIVTNAAWIFFNMIMFFGFIKISYPWGKLFVYVFKYIKNPISLVQVLYLRIQK